MRWEWLRTGRRAALLLALVPLCSFAAGRLVLGIPLEPPNLDPTATSAEATEDVVYCNVYEGLTRIAEDGSTQPALASSWQVSPDGRRYVFQLRRGVRFHDGAAFTAADVIWSLERARAANSVNPLRGMLSGITAISTPDEQTVVIELAQPNPEFVNVLGLGNLVILSPASAAQAATHPIGTGPFRFSDWRKGDAVRLARNPDYWGQPPAMDEVVFRVIPDAASALASLQAGDVDAYPNFPAPETLKQLERDPRFSVVVGSTEGETLLAINNARPPFNDVRVRRALSHAIDRQAVIEGAMFGYGTPIGSHFSPHDPAYLDLTDRYPHDPARARALLQEAGYGKGFSVTLRLPPPMYARRSGEIIAAQLAAVGVRVRIENIEWAQWLEQVFQRHDYDLTIVAHTEPKDYDIYARPDYYFGYHSDHYNQTFASLTALGDVDQRRAVLQDLQRQLADDAVNVWLFELPKLGVWKRGLHGLWREAPIQGIVVSQAAWEQPSRSLSTERKSDAIFGWLGLALLAGALVALAYRAGLRYFAQRIRLLFATLLIASGVVFVLVQVLPGDAAAYMMGLNASRDSILQLRSNLGLDLPLWRQYLTWIWHFAQGDFGISYTYKVPVAELVRERLTLSAPLALLALLLSSAIGLPMALAGAVRPHGKRDRWLARLAQLGVALPNYWLALLLVMGVSIGLQWLPASGFPGWQSGVLHGLKHLLLPALALAIPQACVLARVLRTELGNVLAEDFIRTARATGASDWRVMLRHALPNALIPTLTVVGLQFSFLLAGAVIVESIFALPGIGRLLFQAAAQRDLIVIRSVVLLLVGSVVSVNLVIELLWAIVDPRLRRSSPR